MRRPIGIGGTSGARCADPLRRAGTKLLPAREGLIVGLAAGIQHRFLISACTLVILAASTGVELHAADSHVRIGGATYLGDAPTLVADRHDLFRANGVDAEVDYAVAGKGNLERLRAGEIDFALMALTPLVLDRLSDPTPGGKDDPVILASLVHTTHLNEVLVAADSPINEPADLAGRVVSLTRDTSAEFAWWLFTRYHGLDPNAIEVIDRPANEVADALASGAADAAVLWAPWEARLESRMDRDLRTFAGVDLYTAKWVLVTRRDTCHGMPELCRAILSAYRDAIEFIQQQPDRALDLYAEHAGLDPQYLDEAWEPLVYDLNLDWNVVTTLQQQLDWARQHTPMQDESDGILSMLAPGPLRELLSGSVNIPDPAEEPGQ